MMTPGPDMYVDAGAEKRFFIEMLTKDIELVPAIVDLVDNSVDGARGLHPDGNLTGQWVRIELGDDFEISDNSGGITIDVARHYAFRFGRSKDFVGVKRSVGQFGVGMKRAIFKIGGAFSVASTHRSSEEGGGSRFTLKVDVAEWERQESWNFQFDSLDEGIDLGRDEIAGTSIRVEQLHPSVLDDLNDPTIVQMLQTELQLRHQESIEHGLELYLNSDEPLKASRPLLQASDDMRPIVREFEVQTDSGTVEIKLYAGTVKPKFGRDTDPLDDGQAEKFQDPGEAGWYLFCNDRLLLAADRTPLTGWGNPAAAYHPQYRLFRGYVYLSADDASLLPWNTTKTAVDRDSIVFRSVQSEMKTALVAVQAVLNRAKQLKSDLEDGEESPQYVEVLDTTPDKPIESLPASAQMITPEPPLAKPKRRPGPKTKRIQYHVDAGQYAEAAAALDTSIASEVGRDTFAYFYDHEIR